MNDETTSNVSESTVTTTKEDFLPLKKPERKKSTGGGKNVYSFGWTLSYGNGNNAKISNELYNWLGKPQTLSFAINSDRLAISEYLPNVTEKYTVKTTSGKNIIYSTTLVESIAEQFNISFDDRISYTSRDIELKEIETENCTMKVAYVKLEG